MNNQNKRPLKLHIDGRMLYLSGIGHFLREILKEITNIDKEIKICLRGNEDDYWRYLREYGVSEELISFKKNNCPIYSAREQISGSWNNLVSSSDDIFYYPHYNLPYFINKNCVFTIHDFTQFKFPEYFGKNRVKIAKIILNNSVRKAKKIMAVSKSTANDFYDFFPEYAGKVEVIYNGITKSFNVLDAKKKDVFLRAKNLDKYILFIGNNKLHKNISGLIKAFLDIKKVYKDLKLVIISQGFELAGAGIDEVEKRDIIVIDNIIEEELILYYNCALMLVLPSFYEGFGLPVIEAMACGCPVVTSDVSSMPEVGGDAAIYIDPYDVGSIAEGINKIISDDKLRNDKIRKGHKRARLFTWKRAAKKYIDIFRDLYYIKGCS